MRLSKTERMMLLTQLLILERLYPEDAGKWAKLRKAVENGWQLRIDSYFDRLLDEGLTRDECAEVLEVLNMFLHVRESFALLEDKSGIDPLALEFVGYDHDDGLEARMARYAEDACTDPESQFKSLLPKNADFNSHAPMRENYRQMLDTYNRIVSGDVLARDLSTEDIRQIAQAR